MKKATAHSSTKPQIMPAYPPADIFSPKSSCFTVLTDTLCVWFPVTKGHSSITHSCGVTIHVLLVGQPLIIQRHPKMLDIQRLKLSENKTDLMLTLDT